jgi:hypothetical protein
MPLGLGRRPGTQGQSTHPTRFKTTLRAAALPIGPAQQHKWAPPRMRRLDSLGSELVQEAQADAQGDDSLMFSASVPSPTTTDPSVLRRLIGVIDQLSVVVAGGAAVVARYALTAWSACATFSGVSASGADHRPGH